jgi:hypothetical protein
MSQAGRGRRFLVVAGSIALTLVGALGPASVHAEVLLVSDDRTVGHDFGFGPVDDDAGQGSADATLFSFVAATTIYSVGGSGPFSHEALLQPGQYRLRVQASGGFFSPQADTAYSVQALFAPPVPALSLAGPLWASGLLGWTGWRRLRT